MTSEGTSQSGLLRVDYTLPLLRGMYLFSTGAATKPNAPGSRLARLWPEYKYDLTQDQTGMRPPVGKPWARVRKRK